jgi:hypothetical protein
VSGLTAYHRHSVDLARKLAGLSTVAALREHYSTDDTEIALIRFWGEARARIAELAAIAERLGGDEDQAENARRLAEIRRLLAGFDWEYHDRQLVLEAIERIVDGGAP